MKFKTFKLQNGNFSFEQNILKKAFNFLIHRNEEVSIFSQTKLSDHIQHIVFHIPDEYITGTKKGGIEATQPFSQFINLFVVDKIVFIEEIRKNYTSLIIEALKSNFSISLEECILDTQLILDCIDYYDGNIKQLDLTDKSGDFIDGMENTDLLNTSNFSSNYEIDSIAIQTNRENSNDFISLYRKGILITDSSSEVRIFKLFRFIGEKLGKY